MDNLSDILFTGQKLNDAEYGGSHLKSKSREAEGKSCYEFKDSQGKVLHKENLSQETNKNRTK